MAAGQLIGARVGSGMVLTCGRSLIRPVFLVMVLTLATKVAYDAFREP